MIEHVTTTDKDKTHALAELFKLRPVRFIFVGGVNTTFSYSIYAFFISVGVGYAISNLLALIAGVFFSFHTQGTFVFRNKKNARLVRFIIAWIIIYIANIFIIGQLISFGLNAYISGALAIIPITVFSYAFQKYFVFRPTPAT